MFCDVLFDLYQEILEAIDPDYSYGEVYTPEEVVKMLAQINYVIMLSDFRNYDDTFRLPDDQLRSLALYRAKKDYYIRMKNPLVLGVELDKSEWTGSLGNELIKNIKDFKAKKNSKKKVSKNGSKSKVSKRGSKKQKSKSKKSGSKKKIKK